MKIIFAGTPVFAERHLRALLESEHDICAVYTQPDRPAGRGKKLKPSAVKAVALEHEIPVYQPTNLKTGDAQAQLAELNADVMVVVAYGLILPLTVLETPRYGCLNVHGSILPRWRGAAPIQRAVQAGDSASGVTIMKMDVGLDTGDMLLKRECSIAPDETSASLHDKLSEIGPPALLEALCMLQTGQLRAEKQDDSLANYASKIEKHEAKLDWSKPAEVLEREIRAFNPFPISYAEAAQLRIKIHEALPLTEYPAKLEPGQIQLTKSQIFVGCASGALELTKIQSPGKKAMSVKDFLNGSAQTFPAERFE